MAPALPIYRREEIERMYPKSEGFTKVPENCEVYQLIQNECTYDGNKVICLPFKRMFMRCYEYKNNDLSGYKMQGKNRNSGREEEEEKGIYRNIEITTRQDNQINLNDDLVREFLEADLILKKNMKAYYDKEKDK